MNPYDPVIVVDPEPIHKPGQGVELISKIGVICLAFAVYFALTSLSSYFSFYPYCRINIEQDLLYGNSPTITAALDKIKLEDLKTFQTVCQNVQTISEENCLILTTPITEADANTGLSKTNQGCYVKGTKNIYLTPTKDTSESTIQARAEAIKKYALFSQDFWKDKDKP